MYFICNDWLYGTYLTKVNFFQGIVILLFGRDYAKFVSWWKVKKERETKMFDKKSMTKKAWKEKQKVLRITSTMNLGTRYMKSAKYPTRQERKRIREEF